MLLLVMLSCTLSKSNIDFNPTNSMCLDATVANIHSAGCKAVSVEKTMYGITKIYCYDRDDDSESEWINNDFLGIAFGTNIPDDAKPICTDPYLIMTTSER
jgi:hypothetical protein